MKYENESNEIALLLYLSKINPTEEELSTAGNIIHNGEYSPAFLFALMFDHRVALICFRNMKKNNLIGKLPFKFLHILENYTTHVKERNEKVFAKLGPVFEQLNHLEIPYAPLKGTMLLHNTYKDYSLRYSNDVDILVQEKDLSAISSLLEKHDLEQRIFNYDTAKFEPASKQQKIFHRMTTHELLPFLLYDEVNPDFPYLEVDIQFDIFNRAKNLRQYFDHSKLFEQLCDTPTSLGTMTILRPEYNILQLASHLYQDATRLISIKKGKDLELIRFLDIYEFVNQNSQQIDWEYLASEVEQYNVQHILFYALYYTELLLGEFVPVSFMDKIRPLNLDYLDTFGVEEGLSIKWSKSFVKRMFDLKRMEEIRSVDQDAITQTSKYYKGMEKLKG